jgi:vacuolar protein sorting-associated protein 54
VSTPIRSDGTSGEKSPFAVVEGVQFKVVWSCLLLVEMIMTNLSAAAHFQSLAPNAVTKVVELLRLWNGRTTNLVLGAGAMRSAVKLKSINAKHLSYVTQCLGMMMALLPHIYAALMAQLPTKQHALLSEIDKIKREYQDHNEKVLNKFVSIIGGIVEKSLAPQILGTDFESRARDFPIINGEDVKCCVFLEGISANTKKLHQVLNALLPPDHLQDVFSRIFAYLDEKIPSLFTVTSDAENSGAPSFQLPSTVDGKRRMILEVLYTTKALNALSGVHPWDFTAMNVLERKLDYTLPVATTPSLTKEPPTLSQGTTGKDAEAAVVDTEPAAAEISTANDNTATEIESNEITNGTTLEKPFAATRAEDTLPREVDEANSNGDRSLPPEISEQSLKPMENGNGSTDPEKMEVVSDSVQEFHGDDKDG